MATESSTLQRWSVTPAAIAGDIQKWTDFDVEREWAVVPGSMKQAEITV